ncbi:MAG TPA: hypothetical protein ENN33_07090 [Ignavibacteria bacterium]|nr:hypothetical protein [Ignavibacteria bacterium]
MNKNLIVEIPKRFEKQLRARFDLRRINEEGIIEIACPLCAEYIRALCCGCPFEWTGGNCLTWFRNIYPGYISVCALSVHAISVYDTEKFKDFCKEIKKHWKFV